MHNYPFSISVDRLRASALAPVLLVLSLAVPVETLGQPLSPALNAGRFGQLLELADAYEEEARRTQIQANVHSFLGRVDLYAGEAGPIRSGNTACETGPSRVESGAGWLQEAAAENRVLMFNEDHLSPGARVYVRQQLSMLRELGYTHIGFEAFIPQDENADVETLLGAGYYTLEPTFSALIREADQLGFSLFGYESTATPPVEAGPSERIAVRERGQTDNIIRKLESAPASSRFILFAGWSHIRETPQSASAGELRWMANRLATRTGIDPLTVDLTSCAYRGTDWQGQVHLDKNGEEPVIAGQFAGSVDAQIHLPVPGPDDDASGFYRSTLGTGVEVPAALRLRDQPVLVQALAMTRTDEASFAHDRILLKPGDRGRLYLPPGEYRLRSTVADGRVVGEDRILILSGSRTNGQ